MSKKEYRIKNLDMFQYFYYNFFSNKIVRKGQGRIIPYKHAVLDLGDEAQIILHDGDFHVNYHKPKGSKAEAYVKLMKGAVLEVYQETFLNYKSTIEVHENARIEIGSAYINTGAVLLAAKSIRLGMNNLISREVHIFDADHHSIVDGQGRQKNLPKSVVLEDHVWIGLKTIILRGSWIGTGAMVAAGSVVGGKIKSGTMASGNPARSYSRISWM